MEAPLLHASCGYRATTTRVGVPCRERAVRAEPLVSAGLWSLLLPRARADVGRAGGFTVRSDPARTRTSWTTPRLSRFTLLGNAHPHAQSCGLRLLRHGRGEPCGHPERRVPPIDRRGAPPNHPRRWRV